MTMIAGHVGPDFVLLAADDRMWNASAQTVAFDGDQKILRTARGWVAGTSFYDARLSILATAPAAYGTDGRPQEVAPSFLANFSKAAHHLYPEGPPPEAEDTWGARILIADRGGERPELFHVSTRDGELHRQSPGTAANFPPDVDTDLGRRLVRPIDRAKGLADAVRRMARLALETRRHSDLVVPRLRLAAVVRANGRTALPSWFGRAERWAELSEEEILEAAQSLSSGAERPVLERGGNAELISTSEREIRSGLQIGAGVKGSDGARTGPVNKITERGIAFPDAGGEISFSQNYQNVPLWRPTGGHLTFHPDLGTSNPQVPKIELLNPSPSGGDLKAVLEEVVSGTTPQSAAFSADTHGGVGINDDDYSAEMGSVAAAWDDKYTARFDITAYGGQNCFGDECWCTGGSFTVGFYINDGSGPELQDTYSKSASCSDSTDFDAEITVSNGNLPDQGHPGKEFFMGVESGELDGEYTAHDVTWETGGDPTTRDATENGDYPVQWFAYAKDDG